MIMNMSSGLLSAPKHIKWGCCKHVLMFQGTVSKILWYCLLHPSCILSTQQSSKIAKLMLISLILLRQNGCTHACVGCSTTNRHCDWCLKCETHTIHAQLTPGYWDTTVITLLLNHPFQHPLYLGNIQNTLRILYICQCQMLREQTRNWDKHL